MVIMWTNTNPADLEPMLPAIADANVDVVFSYRASVYGTSTITSLLNACQSNGLKLLLSVRELGKNVVKDRVDKTLSAGELATLSAWCSNFVSHPALYGWYGDDEGTAAQYPISTRQQVYDTVKALDATKQVVEAHYHIESGAYSADVHDLFAFDWYPYVYDAYSNGCVSSSTGLVTSTAKETAAIADYRSRMATAKTTLDAAGDSYIPLIQAFANGPAGSLYYYAMPPAGGITKLWQAAQAEDFADGAGFFLWDSNDTYTLPGEELNGVAAASAQLAEVTVIAASLQVASYDIAYAVDEVTSVPVVATAGLLNVTLGMFAPTVTGTATVTPSPLALTVSPYPPTVVSDYLLAYDIAGVVDAGVSVSIPADYLAVYLAQYPVSVTGTATVTPNTVRITANAWRPDMGWDTTLNPDSDWTTRAADTTAWESPVTVDSAWQTRT